MHSAKFEPAIPASERPQIDAVSRLPPGSAQGYMHVKNGNLPINLQTVYKAAARIATFQNSNFFLSLKLVK
jgi:hypothetical protein